MNTHYIELPQLVGTLAEMPEHHKAVIESYGLACALIAINTDRKRRCEPVRKTDCDNELSSWSDDDFIRIFHERPDLANRLRKMLAEQTITQLPSSSTGHEESENAR